MDAVGRAFDQHVIADGHARAGEASLPERLAVAAARVLAADGCSLSILTSDLRIPLGAACAHSATAERLQFTTGDGPCLGAAAAGTFTRADANDLELRYPAFCAELMLRTPYRSVASAPLAFTPQRRGGAIDLYFRGATAAESVDFAAMASVAQRIVAILIGSLPIPGDQTRYGEVLDVEWLRSSGPQSRMNVWIAVSMVAIQLDLAAVAALDLLRAYAYSSESDIDQVASELVTRALTPDDLR